MSPALRVAIWFGSMLCVLACDPAVTDDSDRVPIDAGGADVLVDESGEPAADAAPDELATEAPVQRIIHGTLDTTDRAVVALTIAGQAFCSGTLVAPRTVFTAGHCVVESGIEAWQVQVFFGTRVGGPGVYASVLEWAAHPGYYVRSDGAPMHDVAYVTLAEDAPVAPFAWHAEPLSSMVGAAVKMVGYGVTDAEHQSGSGTRRSVIEVITAQDDAFLYYGDGHAGTCQGDSGGPTLLDMGGEPVLLAVTSYGDTSCVRLGANTRVDAYADFLGQHVAPETAVEPEPDSSGDEVEPNNADGSAANRLPDPATVSGTIDPAGDVDYFRIVLPTGATLTATLDGPADLGVAVRLYTASGALLAASQDDADLPVTEQWTNEEESKRTLYLKVYCDDASCSSNERYALSVGW